MMFLRNLQEPVTLATIHLASPNIFVNRSSTNTRVVPPFFLVRQ